MEYTQWVVHTAMQIANNFSVLILVVMEYTQWVEGIDWKKWIANVLILVVMEYTQWGLAIVC